MFKVEETSGIPIYMQVVTGLKWEILSGVYGPDDRLPSIRDLAVELHVNPNTIAKAYQEMESLGVIYFKRGQGAFVAPLSKEERMKEAKEKLVQLIGEALDIIQNIGMEKEELAKILDEQIRKRTAK